MTEQLDQAIIAARAEAEGDHYVQPGFLYADAGGIANTNLVSLVNSKALLEVVGGIAMNGIESFSIGVIVEADFYTELAICQTVNK